MNGQRKYSHTLLQCVFSLAVSDESWLHQYVMVCVAARWTPPPPQRGGWSHSCCRAIYRDEAARLAQDITQTRGTAEDVTLGRGQCWPHGCLCLWLTVNSGLQRIPKLPGLRIQIRNLQHLAEDCSVLGSSAQAENVPSSPCG